MTTPKHNKTVAARPYLIVYRVVDGGAAIEVPVIQPVLF